jgi:hypothetical protein
MDLQEIYLFVVEETRKPKVWRYFQEKWLSEHAQCQYSMLHGEIDLATLS